MPIVIKGKDLAPWANNTSFQLSGIYLYRFDGSSFVPIPFQIDKRRRVHYLHNALTKTQYDALSNENKAKVNDVCFYGYFPPDSTICNTWTGTGVPEVRNCPDSYMPEWNSAQLKNHDEIAFMARDVVGGQQDDCNPVHWLDAGGAPGLSDTRLEIKVNIGSSDYFVYAYYWTQTPPANLRANDAPPSFEAETCSLCTGGGAANNQYNVCGTVKTGGDGSLPGYEINFKSNWRTEDLKVRQGSTVNDDLLAIMSMSAQQETDVDWACAGYPRRHGSAGITPAVNGTVRRIMSRQGAKSGYATVRVDKFYDTFMETEIEFRVHELPASGVILTQDQDPSLAPNSGTPTAALFTATSHSQQTPEYYDRLFSGPGYPEKSHQNRNDDWSELIHRTKGGVGVFFFEDRARGPLPAATSDYVYKDDANVHGRFGRKWEEISCTQDGIDNDGGCGSGDPEGSYLKFKRLFRRTIPLIGRNEETLARDVTTDNYDAAGRRPYAEWAAARQQTTTTCGVDGGGSPCAPMLDVSTNGEGAVDLSNSPSQTPAGCVPSLISGYGITRQVGSGPEVLIALVGTGGAFTDRMTVLGQTHTYRSYSFNWQGTTSSKTSPASVTPHDTTAPPAPSVTAAPISGGATVDVQKCVGRDAYAANIYVSSSAGGPFTQVNLSPVYGQQNRATYNISGLQDGVTYYVMAKLVDYSGNLSAASTVVSVTPGP
jgi:hypothetical protein